MVGFGWLKGMMVFRGSPCVSRPPNVCVYCIIVESSRQKSKQTRSCRCTSSKRPGTIELWSLNIWNSCMVGLFWSEVSDEASRSIRCDDGARWSRNWSISRDVMQQSSCHTPGLKHPLLAPHLVLYISQPKRHRWLRDIRQICVSCSRHIIESVQPAATAGEAETWGYFQLDLITIIAAWNTLLE